jgi:hypothetical protein
VLRRKRDNGSPEEVYAVLRSMVLGAAGSGELPAPPPDHPNVLGVVVDIPSQGATATVVALTDNTTSLYTSTGGGTIGGGGHASTANATHALLTAIEQSIESFDPGDDLSIPPPGLVRLHVLTTSGPRVADVPERTFWEGSAHALLPVVAATQRVIAAIRASTPS